MTIIISLLRTLLQFFHYHATEYSFTVTSDVYYVHSSCAHSRGHQQKKMTIVCVVCCAFLIGLIVSLSAITCTFPVHDYGNFSHITSEENKSLLLISIVACVPSLIISSVDLMEQFFLAYKMNALPPQLAEKSFRLLKIIAIFVNITT